MGVMKHRQQDEPERDPVDGDVVADAEARHPEDVLVEVEAAPHRHVEERERQQRASPNMTAHRHAAERPRRLARAEEDREGAGDREADEPGEEVRRSRRGGGSGDRAPRRATCARRRARAARRSPRAGTRTFQPCLRGTSAATTAATSDRDRGVEEARGEDADDRDARSSQTSSRRAELGTAGLVVRAAVSFRVVDIIGLPYLEDAAAPRPSDADRPSCRASPKAFFTSSATFCDLPGVEVDLELLLSPPKSALSGFPSPSASQR